MADEYLSFEDALKVLQMQEAELRTLVAQGKLRAFRDGNMLKFRRTDIDRVKSQRAAAPTAPTPVAPRPDDTAIPQVVTPPAEEKADLFADETLAFDDTAETLVGDAGKPPAGDVELSLDIGGEPPVTPEPATKVPTIELTAPDTGTEDTAVPSLDIGEGTAPTGSTSDTEIPTMVLGLDQYDDTQVATEDVATEEVSLEPGELGADTEEATAPVEEGVAPAGVEPRPEEVEVAPPPGTGRITPASAFGTGEVLAVREMPSALYTVMSALAAFVLVVPGALFFYCVISKQVPDWEFLKPIMRFFWDLLGITPPGSAP